MQGIIALQIPNELAWSLFLQKIDVNEIGKSDEFRRGALHLTALLGESELRIFRQFIALFPTSPVSQFFTGYFVYMGIALDNEESDESDEEKGSGDPDTGFDIMLVCFHNR